MDWRRRTRHQIGWTLLLKLAALIVLWALFFSPPHRVQIGADAVHRQIATDVAPGNGTNGDRR